MQYLTQRELKKMLLFSCEKIEKLKEEINKINVFPVPDQDTGNNLSATLSGIKKAIKNKDFENLEDFSSACLDGSLTSAQGNVGVIFTGFLAGFLSNLENPIDAKKFASAFKEGARRARQSIQNPKEGTILDVIQASVETLEKESKRETDITEALRKTIEKAKDALLSTKEKMKVLKKANFVDAGAFGFLITLEAYLEALENKTEETKKEDKKENEEKSSKEIRRFVQILSYRYEIVSLIKNPKLPEREIKNKLKNLGNCLDIIQIGKRMKIHIHTDYPEEVKEIIRKAGQIESLREEDMAKEVEGKPSVKKTSIGIVTENNSLDIPGEIIKKYKIEKADISVNWQEEEKLFGKNIYQKMREAKKQGIKSLPKTSQPSPKLYLDAFKKQLYRFTYVLCITISHKLSGSYNSACQARDMLPEKERERIYLLDSLQVSCGQALLVLRAIELIQEHRDIREIVNKIKELIPKTHLYIIFDDPRWIESSGRISKSQAEWIRRMRRLNLYPLISLKKGILIKDGITFAKDPAEALFKKIKTESRKERKENKSIRGLIAHADNPELAKKLEKYLEEIKVNVPFIGMAQPAIGVHIGPGSLIAGWMPIT